MSSTTTDQSAQMQVNEPELVVVRLNSMDQEEVHRNAEKKTIHSVVKILPFTIELGLRGQHDPYVIDFHRYTLSSTLLYDTPDERAVDWVKSNPLDCVIQINETGDRATAEVRLHVLSSQHEDLAFRIKFNAVPIPSSRAHKLQSLSVVTDPIKVVSKQSQLKKNKKPPAVRKRQRAAGTTSTPPAPSAVSTPITPAVSSVDTAVTSETHDQARLVEYLARVEAQQRQQQQMIESLVQTVALLQQQQQASHANFSLPATSPAVADVGSPHASQHDFEDDHEPRRKRYRMDDDQQVHDNATHEFERHLCGLLSTFAQLRPQERASTIHRVFQNQADHASEVVEALLAESLTPKQDLVDTGLDLATADLSHHFDALTYDHVPISSARTTGAPSAEGDCDLPFFPLDDNLSQHLFFGLE